MSGAKADRKTALLTGCAGFIGSHLAEALLKKGYAVVGVDNFLTGDPKNIKLLKQYPEFTFLKLDLINPSTTQKLNSLKAQAIAHLASPASPPDYQRYWKETMLVNSVGTLQLLEFAKKQNARFVFASTSEVYGDPSEHPQKESYWGNVNSYGPRAMYDESKRFAEALIWNYRHKLGVNTGIVRIFNSYGPRMRPEDGRVVINFLTQALKGKPLTIHGNGRQTRAFCYVDDMVAGIIKMIERNVEGPVNLGNPREFTVNQLADAVEKLAEKPLKRVSLARPTDDPAKRRPDIKLAKKLLGWQPTIQLEEGLAKTMSWLQKTLHSR
ncbi:GDP-mannose 4,6-dehydratase [Candidatus Berkelbacteria bacterium]|nr:GDP-mannose 4,6-dehydratase [Candidatus Berkelbacteria bacterium]